jgi:voltage-gated potassium channel
MSKSEIAFKVKDFILILLAIVFLVVFSIPAFYENLGETASNTLEQILWFIWGVFILDFGFEFFKASEKKSYLIKHWFDVLALIFPFFRPLRLMRLFSFGSLLLSKVSVAKSMNIAIKVAITAIFIAYVCGIQITLIERPIEGSNIKNAADGLWWAITTVTTVGYGDRFPVTTAGRSIAFGLMVVGISLVGVITANVAAWFVRMNENKEK